MSEVPLWCACGKPLHYTDPANRRMIDTLIEAAGSQNILVTVGGRTWVVQRHFIALHGIRVHQLANLKFPEVLGDYVRVHYRYDKGATRLVRKSASAHALEPDNQRFTHIDEQTGEPRHFHIPKLKRLLETDELVQFPITPDQAKVVEENRGIDPAHLGKVLVDEPGIMCEFDDGSFLIVDGSHRFVQRSRLGHSSMNFKVAKPPVWRKSLLNMTYE